jgi:Transcriptional Coactivator p15 (PC4)
MTTLPEPIETGKFWANRRGEAVIVCLREYQGTLIVDVRRHYTAADGKLRPTSKGLALTIAKLPELTAAINKAFAKAKQLGLVDDEAGHG